jgi:hypothetical protein
VSQFTSLVSGLSYHCEIGLHTEAELRSSQMTAIAKMLASAFETQDDLETFLTLVLFCGAGLVVSLFALLEAWI